MFRLELLEDFETVIKVLRTRVQLGRYERDDETPVWVRAHLEGIRGCGFLLLVLRLLRGLVLVRSIERRELRGMRRGGDRRGHRCRMQTASSREGTS